MLGNKSEQAWHRLSQLPLEKENMKADLMSLKTTSCERFCKLWTYMIGWCLTTMRLHSWRFSALLILSILFLPCLSPAASHPLSVPLAMPANLEVTPSSYSTLRVSWGAAPGATQYMILYSALNHGEPDDAKEVNTNVHGFLSLGQRGDSFLTFTPH